MSAQTAIEDDFEHYFNATCRLTAQLEATKAVLGYREAELLALKGPCSNRACRLHYAHSGPCDCVKET